MARTITEIYDSIVTGVNSEPDLPNASTSIVAKWRLFAAIIAAAIYVHEVLWDAFRSEVDEFAAGIIPGTVRWYHEQCLKFQYGDALEYIDHKFKYAVIDSNKQIVKRVAVSEAGGQVRIKISKETSGIPEPLSVNELAAFTNYINLIKFAGTNIAIINYDPDLLNIELNITYDALVMNPDGSLITDVNVLPVNMAIDEYIRNIVYGGIFNNTKLIDAVQSATGVLDPVLVLAEGKAHNAANFTTINQNYPFVAGYAIVNTLTINYNANV